MANEQGNGLLAHWLLLGAAARDKGLGKADVAVLWCVLQMINSKTGLTFPSFDTLSRAAGVCTRSGIRSINRLCERGYLVKTSRKGRGIDRSNVYRAGVITDGAVTDKSVTDGAVTDKSVTDSAVTDKTVPQSLTSSSVEGVTNLSDISASKSYQPQLSASTTPDALRPVDLWADGIRLLTDAGTSREDAGRTIGSLRKQLGEDEALDVVQKMLAIRPTGPKSYLFGVIAKRKKAPTSGLLPRDSRSDDDLAAANEAAARRMLMRVNA